MPYILCRREDGKIVNAARWRIPKFDPATYVMLTMDDMPDLALRWDGATGLRAESEPEIAARRDASAAERFDSDLLLRAVVTWTAQRLGVLGGQAKAQILAIYRSLGGASPWFSAQHRPVRDMLIFWYAILLHVVWAWLLLITSTRIVATPLATFDAWRYAGVPIGALASVLASGLALWAVALTGPWWALLPQHVCFILSASDSAWASLRGEYADGVTRPWPFILADQAPNLLLMIAYTVAMVEHCVWTYRSGWRGWAHWMVAIHLLIFTTLLAVAAVVSSAESRVDGRMLAQAVKADDGHFEVDRYRLGQLEQHMDEAAAERKWITWLLISNLVALLASMSTFLIKSKFERRSDPPDLRQQERRRDE